MNPDGMTKDKDGAYRGGFTISYDQPKDGTLRRTTLVNGKLMNEMRVKLDDAGILCTQVIQDGKTTDHNPPKNVHPLPPSLTHGVTWKCPADVKGADQDLVFFGPLMLHGPEGPTTGYIIYGEGPVEGAPAGSTGVSVQTMERHYIPKIGVVRENRAVLVDGKLLARQEFTLAAPGYRLVADPKMKGRLGCVQIDFPKETKTSGANIEIFKAGEPATGGTALAQGYGEKKFDLMPGKYEVAINGRRVPVVVKSGHATIHAPACCACTHRVTRIGVFLTRPTRRRSPRNTERRMSRCHRGRSCLRFPARPKRLRSWMVRLRSSSGSPQDAACR